MQLNSLNSSKPQKTIQLIHFADKPPDRRENFGYYNPQVKEKYKDGKIDIRTRGTIGENVINHPGLTSLRIASLETAKILTNSAVSTNVDLTTCDVKNFYLCQNIYVNSRRNYTQI
jgi:hypothetical protein